MSPVLHGFAPVDSGQREFFVEFVLTLSSIFIRNKLILWADISIVLYSGQLSSQEMSLFARERRYTLDSGIEVSSQHLLDRARCLNVSGLAFWQLDPVLIELIAYPEHTCVHSIASSLSLGVSWNLFFLWKGANSDPIIFLSAHDFAEKSHVGCS